MGLCCILWKTPSSFLPFAPRSARRAPARCAARGPDDLAAAVITEAIRRAPGIDPADVDDVILGCAMPEAEQGLNVARIASLRAGIPVGASAVTVNRFCSSGLQAIAYAAERVMCGFASAIVAGGTESMSLVPMGGHKIAPNPTLMDRYPDVYLSTGLVAENHARANPASRARSRTASRSPAISARSRPSTAAASSMKSSRSRPPSSNRRTAAAARPVDSQADVRRSTRGRGAIRPRTRWPNCGRPFTPRAPSRPAIRRK